MSLPGNPIPSRAALRALLGALFKADTDLDAFLLDRFFSVRQRIGGGMDRVAKTNLLLEHVSPEDLWNVLTIHYHANSADYREFLRESTKNSEAWQRREELRNQLDQFLRDQEVLERHNVDTSRIQDSILTVRRRLRGGLNLQERDVLSGRYSLMERLGLGGVATVWQACDRTEDVASEHRVVAIKVLHGQLAADLTAIERFQRGARRMKELQHPAIVSVLDGPIEDDEIHYFSMEYLPNRTLRDAVRERKISTEQALRAILEVGRALSAAHARKLVHRDVKPTNILMDGQWRARLTDFDLVLGPRDTALSIIGQPKGSYGYAAPELMRGSADQDLRADIYGLGMTALFVLFGEDLPPLEDSRPKDVIAALPVREELKAVLWRATAADKAERFDSVMEFCEEFIQTASLGNQDPEASGEPPSRSSLKVRSSGQSHPSVHAPALEPTVPIARLGAPSDPLGKRGARVRALRVAFLILSLSAGASVIMLSLVPRRSKTARRTGAATPELASPGSAQRPNPPPLVLQSGSTAESEGMVYIPAGQFSMGSDDGEPHERPLHVEQINAFYIDRTEVTVESYRECVQAGICKPATTVHWSNITEVEREKWSQFCTWNQPKLTHHPINCVDWYQARAYCIWKNLRLPSEMEWEYAARGSDARMYPWGNQLPGPLLLNACGDECINQLAKVVREDWRRMYTGSDGWPATAPIGAIPGDRSPFGVFDMAGNVAEWVNDEYKECYRADCRVNEQLHVVRGSAWASADATFPRCANRGIRAPDRRHDRVGFRCARNL
jgi:formylglycine-generating enzyme required for sulfatase activity